MKARCGLEDCDCGHTIEVLRGLLQEIWDTIPADLEGPQVERHSRVLIKILPTLGLKAPCGHCGGHGACATNGADMGGVNCDDPQLVCPHCKGVQQ